jgi:hypothetical protein
MNRLFIIHHSSFIIQEMDILPIVFIAGFVFLCSAFGDESPPPNGGALPPSF